MDALQLAKEIEHEVVGWRRYLHENPESSMQEHETIQFVVNKLAEFGIATEIVKNGGIIGTLHGNGEGKTIILRSDLDALPMEEAPDNLKGKKAVVSKTDKAAHMCGHDAHMAMLLGAAKILAQYRDTFSGKILFAFEQGEEIGGGIQSLLTRLVELGADGVWGIHVKSDLASGKISVESGPRMSAIYPFHVEITGKGGHGSRPDLAASPIDCFHQMYEQLQAGRLTQLDPFQPITYSIGSLHAGSKTTGNIIPNTLEFRGTARFLHAEQGERFADLLKSSLDHATEAAEYSWKYLQDTEPMDISVYNQEECSQLAAEVIEGSMGKGVVTSHPAWMASEPFSFYQQYFPGVFAFLGIENEAKGTGAEHHNPHFDVDEDALCIGVAATVGYAVAFLKLDMAIDFSPEQLSVAALFEKVGL